MVSLLTPFNPNYYYVPLPKSNKGSMHIIHRRENWDKHKGVNACANERQQLPSVSVRNRLCYFNREHTNSKQQWNIPRLCVRIWSSGNIITLLSVCGSHWLFSEVAFRLEAELRTLISRDVSPSQLRQTEITKESASIKCEGAKLEKTVLIFEKLSGFSYFMKLAINISLVIHNKPFYSNFFNSDNDRYNDIIITPLIMIFCV
jgi:hypothetical protein